MKKRIFISIFIFGFLTQNSFSYKQNSSFSENNQQIEFIKENKIQKVKFTKKDLKREIKNRKKYHRILLEKYNKNFEKKYFDFIVENSLILSNLRKEIKK